MNCYFMQQDGQTFKAQARYAPYFLLATKPECEHDVEAFLRRRYEGKIHDVEMVDKEDLDLKNHLSGLKQRYLKVTFATVQDLMDVRREVLPTARRNAQKNEAAEAYEALHAMELERGGAPGRAHHRETERGGDGRAPSRGKRAVANYADAIVDIREYDVPYHMRWLIDTDTRCGWWYDVRASAGDVSLRHRADLLARGEVRVCAFDIETTKLPLKFPDAEFDQVFMISYMLDGQGYLIINREVVGADVDDFEYSPKPEYPGPFIVWNEPDEAALLRRWFDHMRETQPCVYVTYNGDFFDWPFVETRAEKQGMSLYDELGFRCDRKTGECRSRSALHLDAFAWVKRDSYLPAGSHGLKAVTKAKLKYNPVEVDPEDMLPFAQTQPQTMAAYSVSDAVSTYYLYMKYVHPFIFSLATIIPMSPDEVLRKGSGTLCEALLMVQAYQGNIVCPNKTQSAGEKHYKGHLLESETYIGGHVECLEAGVFRADIPTTFRLNPKGYQKLLDSLDDDLAYALRTEGKGMVPGDCANYAETRAAIVAKLEALRDNPNQSATPLIYHLDVAAMYPNIILTNRLQPPAMVTEDTCAACDYNRPGKTCLREMEWLWRGEHYAASSSDYSAIKAQLEAEKFPPRADGFGGDGPRYWADLSHEEQAAAKKARLKMYSQKVYKRVLDKPVTQERVAGVCQRENGFYVDTVLGFRDRRYVYKGKNKEWKGKLDEAKALGNPIAIQEANDMVTLFDSLQLAHKCILNSFYGYVMRKGARWYSMEMAGVVTYTGAKIIQMAKKLVDDIGKPLELDTDGIWCCLPGSFPEEFSLTPTTESGFKKSLKISYPCSILNRLTAVMCTNDQYQVKSDEKDGGYTTKSEMSIEFEVDGPYKAMILPASKEEGKLIKKRYAVFNFDGSLEELKGFEVKRRGELKLIKMFQTEVFEKFLAGDTLEGVYASVGAVANKWLDVLETKGRDLTDEDLVEYISEATTMSKSLEEYGDRKSCATTCARRLGAFIGGDVMQDKGLKAQYIITSKPAGAPTSARAVPVTIFQAEPAVARAFLKEWTKEAPAGDPEETPDMRTLVDWDYYTTRLSSAVQKIISIPAALQHVANPCPRVAHPDWLHKMVRDKDDTFKQKKLKDLFAKHALAEADANAAPPRGDDGEQHVTPGKPPRDAALAPDMEDAHGGSLIGRTPGTAGRPRVRRFFANEAEDRAPGAPTGSGGAMPTTPETGARAGAGARAPGSGPSPALASYRGAPDAVALAKRRLEALGAEPDKKEDYGAWLSFQKARWDVIKTKRKRKRAEEAESLARASGATPGAGRATRPRVLGPGGLGAFAESREKVLARSAWQVIALEPEAGADGAAEPGRFAAWILAEGSMHRVTLRARRVVAVATRAPDREGDLGAGGKRRVAATLPRGARAAHVYEVSMDERDFVSGLEANDLLADPNVVGVFERHVPLVESAIQKLGCVALMNEETRLRARHDGGHALPGADGEYDARTLDSRAVAEFGYLPLAPPSDSAAGETQRAPPGATRHVALYRVGTRDKGVFVLHTPGAPDLPSLLVLVAPGALGANGKVRRSAAEVGAAAAAKFFQMAETPGGWSADAEDDDSRRASMSMSEDGDLEIAEEEEETRGDARVPARAWRVEYARSDADAGAIVSRALASYLERHAGPCVCVLEDAGGFSATREPRTLASGDDGSARIEHDGFDTHDDDFLSQEEFDQNGRSSRSRAGAPAREGAAGRMTRLVPALARLPVTCVPADPADARVSAPALGWQVPLVKTALARVAAHAAWLRARVAVCRYAHIPLGNLGKDWCLHVADTFFARALRDDAQLLWTGPGGAPDLGGGAVETSPGVMDETTSMDSARAEVCAPGAYRAVCVEFKTHHLAVCAIANAHLLNDLERGALLGYDAPGGTSRGGNTSEIDRGRGGHEASAAFGVLRKLVNDWLVDATERHNPHADALLGQLRRWLLSDDSALREPSLRHLVELCVRKTFTLLLAEMKKLGATVVFADARRVIVSTGKRRLANASAFVEGMRASLRKRELFSWLELEPVKQWHALLFRGPFDYGGLVASALPTASQWAGHDTQGPDDDELDPCAVNGGDGGHGEALDMHWNVASFLPESLREHFEVLVGEFIFRPWKRERGDGDGDAAGASAKPETVALDEEGDEALETAPRGGAPAEKQEGPGGLPLGREAAAAAEEARVAWLAGQIEGYFSQRILRLVGEIQKHLGPGSATRNNPEHRFPTPPGAHLSDTARGTPALAFVKTLCAVFGLDAAAAGPVALLRKNALKLLRVPEYAPEATFREPCVTFTLRDVVCEHCGDCRDVDLCRDERLVEDGTWECLSCDRAYDVEWVESTLVRRINERLRRTQTQDLRCARDGAIKVGRLASRCACGGLFKCVEHKRAAADDLRVMRSIAERHGFETLKDVVDWVDERSPNLER